MSRSCFVPIMSEWYFVDTGGAQNGPVPKAALKEAWGSGRITGPCLCWCETMSDWAQVESLPDLMNFLNPPKPKLPTPGRHLFQRSKPLLSFPRYFPTILPSPFLSTGPKPPGARPTPPGKPAAPEPVAPAARAPQPTAPAARGLYI